MTMGYAEQNLMPGEEIVYKAKLHWALFLRPIGPLLFTIIIAALGSISSDTSFFQCLTVVFFLLTIVTAIFAVITYLTTEFALTNKRVIAKSGFIRRRSVELLLQKIESIGVNQPILGRILDYGTITVTGTGGTKEPFETIAEPMELRKRVNAQISGGG
jgi:uncharacterized membrane protein YdbT with pleckstrin-like domain